MRFQEPFSGVNVILAGDFFQLPPVRGRALYHRHNEPKSLEEILSATYYYRLTTTVKLTTPIHQQGDDSTTIAFRAALDHLRLKTPTITD